MSKPLKTGLFALLIGMAVLFSGFLKQEDIYFQIRKNLSIFSELYKEVSVLYIDEIPPAELLGAGVDAMLEKLDPYTVFIAEGEQSRMEILSSGSFGGIGLDAGFRGDELVVIAPLEGYPAERAGVRPGDVVLRVDDVPAEDLTMEEFQNLTLGDIGSVMELVLYRPAIGKEIRFELTREKIEAKNVTYTGRLGPNNEILYIQLAQFGQQSAEEIRSAMLGEGAGVEDAGLEDAGEGSSESGEVESGEDEAGEVESGEVESGEVGDAGAGNAGSGNDRKPSFPEPQGLILDLRNNPGGLLNEAVEIVDKFIEPGVTVVETLGRNASQNNIYPTREPVMFEDLPIVILMNEGSASASEIVSGALQDLDRAVILGRTSFGKGLVQIIRPLPYNTSLKLTVSEYAIPSGRRIQAIRYGADREEGSENQQSARAFKTKNGRTVYDGNGIKPDIEMPEENRSLAETALLQENHFFFFVNRELAGQVVEGSLDRGEEQGEEQMTGQVVEQMGAAAESSDRIAARSASVQPLPEVDGVFFERFLEYLEESNFDFRTPADDTIDDLKDRAVYFSDAAELDRQIRELQQLSERYKREELENSRTFIVRELERQIVAQLRGRSAEQQYLLENDLWIDTALEMIRNRDNYRSVLMP